MLRKAALQLHIGTQSGASPSRNEGFREFEADLSALFLIALEGINDDWFDSCSFKK